MRGLGIGILITTIILTISNNVRNNELKTQINSLQAELMKNEIPTLAVSKTEEPTEGLTEENNDATVQGDTLAAWMTESETVAATTTVAETTKAPITTAAATTKAPTTTVAVTTKAVTTAATTVRAASGNEKTISFANAGSSEAVSMLLEEAGLVDDWKKFNQYLCDNGYDRKISSRTFTFTGKETYQELAEKITGR